MKEQKPNSTREEILREAIKMTCERRTAYGDPSDTMGRIEDASSIIIGAMDLKDQVRYPNVLMPVRMIVLKLVRAMKDPENMDHWIDAAAYCAIAAENAKQI